MYCLDLWPESLIAGGIGRSSLIYKFFHRVSRNIYTKMDKILVTSREFTGYLQSQFGIPEETARPAVEAFIDQLRKNELLDEAE
jgi:hypothetical protein